ncbi:hypothetical protein [Halobacteriaceae bacterium SHR40]|uniref:hypothetical protein n=1 Tax=Halovenus amylolytica TaxID=2500550 RepID=UPI000FE308B8
MYPAGIAALVVFAAAIYLRGYLVPGTPELTQRYFSHWLLRAFGKDPFEDVQTTDGGVEPTEAAADRPEPAETEQLLRDAGVVEEAPDEDCLCLTAEFREVWWRRIRNYREDDDRAAAQLASVVDVDPEQLAFVDEENYFGVEFAGELIGRWSSDAAFYADLAAEPTLAEWLPEWGELGD